MWSSFEEERVSESSPVVDTWAGYCSLGTDQHPPGRNVGERGSPVRIVGCCCTETAGTSLPVPMASLAVLRCGQPAVGYNESSQHLLGWGLVRHRAPRQVAAGHARVATGSTEVTRQTKRNAVFQLWTTRTLDPGRRTVGQMPRGAGSDGRRIDSGWSMSLMNLNQNILLLMTNFPWHHDWVVTTLGPWMAAEDSGESHPATSEYAKSFYCLVGVL